MSRRHTRPARRGRSEIVPILAVLLSGLGVYALLPREMFSDFTVKGGAEPDQVAPVGCAFVTLDASEERAAMAAARTSWQADAQAVRRTVELLPRTLAEGRPEPVAPRTCPARTRDDGRTSPQVRLLPPTAAAGEPARIESDESAAELPFSREALLRLPD